jgi:hypothetical protein
MTQTAPLGITRRCALAASVALGLCLGVCLVWSQAKAQVPPQRGFGSDMPPGGSGSFNPTGPSTTAPLGTIPPMPPGGSGSFNPTGPLPGGPPGYIPAMPPGGRGSFNPTAPAPQPGVAGRPGVPRGGINSMRVDPPTTRTGKAPVAPGLENCLKGWNPKRGLSKKEHRATCERIWKRREPSS